MKKIFVLLALSILAISCKKGNKDEKILRPSVGSTNTILTVTKSSLWTTNVGDEIRSVFGEHQVGLPQPETLVSMGQVDPSGFTNIMNNNRLIMIVQVGDKKNISIEYDKYAKPQTIVYVTGKDELDLVDLIKNRGSEIIKTFKDSEVKFRQSVLSQNKLDEQKFETIKKLGISLTIPDDFRLVKDSIGFLWLRQHLKSGIARGAGNNNILIYSYPLKDKNTIRNNITLMRDEFGKNHIPGSKEDMYMITEKAYTPFTFDAEINNKKAFETRGKWEVKNDFMAGPFINYTIIDEEKNRVIVFEGFTYAPSINKRDFIFDLEAIGKSIEIK